MSGWASCNLVGQSSGFGRACPHVVNSQLRPQSAWSGQIWSNSAQVGPNWAEWDTHRQTGPVVLRVAQITNSVFQRCAAVFGDSVRLSKISFSLAPKLIVDSQRPVDPPSLATFECARVARRGALGILTISSEGLVGSSKSLVLPSALPSFERGLSIVRH